MFTQIYVLAKTKLIFATLVFPVILLKMSLVFIAGPQTNWTSFICTEYIVLFWICELIEFRCQSYNLSEV